MANQPRLPADDAGNNERDTHETRKQSRGHDARVDDASEERATRQTSPSPWVRPSSLAAPPARDGYVQRWIRITVRGEADPRNVNMKMREGWTPRDVSTVPKEFLGFGVSAQQSEGRFVVDDLMLCEMPKEMYQQRARYYREQTELQMAAVEADLEDIQVPGQPIVKTHKSTVSFPARRTQQGGRRVEAAPEDDF